ncbi:MAG TPA: VTT domain-containing protein [Tepidisphaeraceae bacterium]|nr:VTT domain-containing protein [Tepidisphaeraceae bacterium]
MQKKSKVKLGILGIVAILAIVAAGMMLFTEQGREIRNDPREFGKKMRQWVELHPLEAPLAYIAAYTIVGALALPVWWLPVLAGHAFGLVAGIFWTQIASTSAAIAAGTLSRFLLADWFRRRIEAHTVRLQQLDEKLGHNGLLAVFAVRLAHFIPAGVSNYAFGLTTISLRDIAVGTFIAGLPSTALEVTIGAAPQMLSDWRYVAILAVLNIAPIGALIVRYIRPDWFKSIGIE